MLSYQLQSRHKFWFTAYFATSKAGFNNVKYYFGGSKKIDDRYKITNSMHV